jgi:hypothetical protein
MGCINLGPAILPKIPNIFLPSAPFLAMPLIPPGGVSCCRFQVAIPGLEQQLAVINLAVSGALLSLSSGAMVEIMTINEIITQAQIQLNKLVLNIPSCPIDGKTI